MRIEDIQIGVRLGADGKTGEARRFFMRLWDTPGEDDSLARCFLAHSMADVQEDIEEELRWDLIALAVADQVTDEQAAERNVPGGRLGLYPSLHLNIAGVYRRLGNEAAAREHYVAGRRHLHLLADDVYGRRLRRGFDRFESGLAV